MINPGRVAEIIVERIDGGATRGSGYRIAATAVLTAAHVLDGAAAVRVRFDADRPTEWETSDVSWWICPSADLAVLSILPPDGEDELPAARIGRIRDEDAVLHARTMGFPLWKLKNYDGATAHYRDTHAAIGSVAVLSNRREGTLEFTVAAPERDPDPEVSPWQGMSGAPLWVGDRIVGVIAKHHRREGPGRLTVVRLDRALAGLDSTGRSRFGVGVPLDELPDVVPRDTADVVTTAYRLQVVDIAPDLLLGREEELSELTRFCAGEEAYAWWQAGPWAGKTALMSWFVLHPPAGVDVVAFFVTGRLAGQADSEAFTEALLEQLAALTGERMPDGLGNRYGHVLRLLDAAGKRCRELHRRLVIVVDGLDEDTGVSTGKPSIATLLPRRLPAEVRVLVASRPNPSLPLDVPGAHPLKACVTRELSRSQHAMDIELNATHELSRLLAGTQAQRDLLGHLTGSGGGLTLPELEELTTLPRYQLDELLGGAFGRTVGDRITTPMLQGPQERVYLFAHETLRAVAQDKFGAGLKPYRDRIMAWANDYRARGWPQDTPQYLMRGYGRMLADRGDIAELASLATDAARHDRMLDLTGGDTLALNEILAAENAVCRSPQPDLAALLLLSAQRLRLERRNSVIPTKLPAAWARLGEVARAEALARSISEPYRRTNAMGELAERLAVAGLPERAEALAREITDADRRERVLVRLIDAAAARGDHHEVASLLADIAFVEPSRRAHVRAAHAEAATIAGDHQRAGVLLAEAEKAARAITKPYWRAKAIARLAEITMVVAGRDTALSIVDESKRLAESVIRKDRRARALARCAEAAAILGEVDRVRALLDEAETTAGKLTHAERQVHTLAAVAEAAVTASDPQRMWSLLDMAKTVAPVIPEAEALVIALVRMVLAALGMGDPVQVRLLLDEAERQAREISELDRRANALAAVADGTAAAGDKNRAEPLLVEAEGLARTVEDPYWQIAGLAALAEAASTIGDRVRALALAEQIPDPARRVEVLAALASAAAVDGDHGSARSLLGTAERSTSAITDAGVLAHSLIGLAQAAVAAHCPDLARSILERTGTVAQSDPDPRTKLSVLCTLITAATAAGANDVARSALTSAKDLVDVEPFRMVELIGAVAASADYATAQALVAAAPWPYQQVYEEAVIDAMAEAGAYDEAEAFANAAERWSRSDLLTRIAGWLAAEGEYRRATALKPGSVPPTWKAQNYASTGNYADASKAILTLGDERRSSALVELATTAIANGDRQQALVWLNEAETLADRLPSEAYRAEVLAPLATALAAAGEQARAGIVADRIAVSEKRSRVQREMVESLVEAGNDQLAEEIAYRIQDLAGQARRLIAIVEHIADSSPDRARHLLANAVVRLNWLEAIHVVARFDRTAVLAVLDPLTASVLPD